MPDTVFGVPLHPLVTHAVVVLVPLAVLGTLLITVVPRWRTAYGWLVVAAAALAFGGVPVATRSGRNFEASLELGGPVLDKVQDHQEMGDRLIWAVGAMFVLDLVLMLMHRAGRPTGQTTLVGVLGSIAGLVALVVVALTGHLGAQAVWNPAG
ncbi:MAG TPA: DUF2231 domain-containing protein [Jiangellaceae bacterium]|nr:DUF2231 domain-containing protein [Jiangellaceae bacterium]